MELQPAVSVDASVGAKWFWPDEDDCGEALALLELFGAGRIAIIVPELFFSEMGNLLLVAARRLRVPAATAVASLQELDRLGLERFSSAGQLRSAMAFAQHLRVSFYDALYLATAEVAGVPLVTCDQRLVSTVSGQLDWVMSPTAALTRFYPK
jgi:predicted nucleic acid-binding protein